MKASMDEDVMIADVKIVSSLAEGSDTTLFMCGRNAAIRKSMLFQIKKEIKPKPRIIMRKLEPDTEEFMKVIRSADCTTVSLDPADTMLHVTKRVAKGLSAVKAGPRRFVPGNTAFACFFFYSVSTASPLFLFIMLFFYLPLGSYM